MRDIKESDWKLLRKVHPVALERFCRQVLEDIAHAASISSQSYHARYLDVYRLLQERNDDMILVFDDLRRSRAMMCLAAMKSRGLIQEDEFSMFSEETRSVVDSYLA